MARTVGIGRQDFEGIRMNGYFYVDKTDFIREWWESGDSVTLIARPRRFGKTLNMSMLEQFFSVRYAGKGEWFEGLKIWEKEEFRKLQGAWPVIALSFANVKAGDYVTARKSLCQILSVLYSENRFLLETGTLDEKETQFFREISMGMDDAHAFAAIHQMSLYLSRYYGKKVIILLDEYDTPMQEAYVSGYWKEMTGFIRSLFNSTFKTNPYLERAVMTGITRVSKESIFSDLNNLEVVTTTSEAYADSFGFTEEEVFAALDEFGLSDRKKEVKDWYDGFTFGSRPDIYNPWSIINYLDKKKLGVYWANTSSNSLAGKLLREGNKETKQVFEGLLKGETFMAEIDEQIVYDQLSGKKNAIWSLLLAGGYLRVVKSSFDEEAGCSSYTLALTNKEVRLMFEGLIRGWFSDYDDSCNYSDFIKALLLGDVEAMNDYINEISRSIFSYFDTGKNPSRKEPERFYHGFVLGLMAELKGRYVITSNRESGFGRYDIMLEPLGAEDDAMIIEFKVFKPRTEDSLSDTVEAALRQIEEKNYEAVLRAKGIPEERIRKYGFAFKGQEVLIG